MPEIVPEALARTAQIAAGLASARARIAEACNAVGRRVDEVDLLVVTKTFPASDVAILADLGCRDVGENRDQEAKVKRAQIAPDGALRWHMIGQLQSNKAKSVCAWADVVESVDRIPLVHALAAAAAPREQRLEVLIQVSLDPVGTQGRGGATEQDLTALVDAVLGSPMLRLRGLMGVAPQHGDAAAAFVRLATVWRDLRRQVPEADVLSAGMSDDLEAAISAGATQVRLGSAVLGNRNIVQ